MKKLADFNTKKEFFNYLITNKKEIIDFKKSYLQKSEPFLFAKSEESVIKSLNTHYKDDLSTGIIKRSIVGNTYNWIDKHGDVHLDGVFSKSISERQDKIWHLHDHIQQITAKVGKPINIYEKSVNWSDLGVKKKGKTMILVMESNIMKDYNPLIYGQYLSNEIDQHSVGMYYINLDLAVNDPEMKAEYSTWNKIIDKLGNKEKAEEEGFFWAVKEAKLIETSAVLAGSNELTPTMPNIESTKNFPQNIDLSKKINNIADRFSL